VDRLGREGDLDAQALGQPQDLAAELVAARHLVGVRRDAEVDLDQEFDATRPQVADVDPRVFQESR
jgi:hypothetical protein